MQCPVCTTARSCHRKPPLPRSTATPARRGLRSRAETQRAGRSWRNPEPNKPCRRQRSTRTGRGYDPMASYVRLASRIRRAAGEWPPRCRAMYFDDRHSTFPSVTPSLSCHALQRRLALVRVAQVPLADPPRCFSHQDTPALGSRKFALHPSRASYQHARRGYLNDRGNALLANSKQRPSFSGLQLRIE